MSHHKHMSDDEHGRLHRGHDPNHHDVAHGHLGVHHKHSDLGKAPLPHRGSHSQKHGGDIRTRAYIRKAVP